MTNNGPSSFSGDTGNSPRRPRTRRMASGAVKARAEQLSALTFGDANDWERFIDQATGELQFEAYEAHLKSEGWEFVSRYD